MTSATNNEPFYQYIQEVSLGKDFVGLVRAVWPILLRVLRGFASDPSPIQIQRFAYSYAAFVRIYTHYTHSFRYNNLLFTLNSPGTLNFPGPQIFGEKVEELFCLTLVSVPAALVTAMQCTTPC